MPQTENSLLLRRLMSQCTTEFFQSRSVVLRDAPEPSGIIEHAAAIGFSGKDMRGVVGIGMETATLHAIVASQPLTSHHIPVEDWLGEAANQLLGRFKNKLVNYGTVVTIALPMILRGMRMQFVSMGAEGLWTYFVDSGAGQICVWLDVRLNDGYSLELSDDPEQMSASEGAMVLF